MAMIELAISLPHLLLQGKYWRLIVLLNSLYPGLKYVF